MISLIMLLWIGTVINAPTWYFVLGTIGLVCAILSYGIKMYEKGKKELD